MSHAPAHGPACQRIPGGGGHHGGGGGGGWHHFVVTRALYGTPAASRDVTYILQVRVW